MSAVGPVSTMALIPRARRKGREVDQLPPRSSVAKNQYFYHHSPSTLLKTLTRTFLALLYALKGLEQVLYVWYLPIMRHLQCIVRCRSLSDEIRVNLCNESLFICLRIWADDGILCTRQGAFPQQPTSFLNWTITASPTNALLHGGPLAGCCEDGDEASGSIQRR
jgi:hypothetical protein